MTPEDTQSKDKRKGWMRDLSEGDRVCIEKYYTGYQGPHYSFGKITRITPTGLVKIGSSVFNPDGRGKGHYSGDLVQYNDLIAQRIHRTKLLRTLPKQLTEYKLKHLSTEQLENIAAIIAQGKEDVE